MVIGLDGFPQRENRMENPADVACGVDRGEPGGMSVGEQLAAHHAGGYQGARFRR